MYVIRYSFYFRYGTNQIVLDIPAEDYIASGRQLDEYEVWEFILQDPALSEELANQEQDYSIWMKMSDYYDKCLQRRNTNLVLAKLDS